MTRKEREGNRGYEGWIERRGKREKDGEGFPCNELGWLG